MTYKEQFPSISEFKNYIYDKSKTYRYDGGFVIDTQWIQGLVPNGIYTEEEAIKYMYENL